jgi:hypothetical protein
MMMTSSLVMAPGPIRQRASRPPASAMPPVLERQSSPQHPKNHRERLTSMNLHTALATRFANFSTVIVLCAGVWSLVMIWLLHSL